jgi:hypothetical protein
MGMVGSSENANDPVKWFRLARRLRTVGRLPLNLADHLFDVLGKLIVHVRHWAPSQGRTGSELIAAAMRPA